MKRLYTLLTHRLANAFSIFCLLAVFASCDNKDIDSFDTATSYLYFDVPYILNADGTSSEFREDSIYYSFAIYPETVTSNTLKVVVKTIGMATDYDRPYTVEIVDDITTATSAEWDPSVVDNRSIKAGELADTIFIDVQRTKALSERWMHVYLRIIPNEYFAAGYGTLQEVKVAFSDVLAEPSWWRGWTGVFGSYYPEVYRKWIELYPLGADTNTHLDNGQPLYWNNMPSNSTQYQSWYPVLALYAAELKEYFELNDVYPNGDTSLPAIKLP